jgi:hypothetical protein
MPPGVPVSCETIFGPGLVGSAAFAIVAPLTSVPEPTAVTVRTSATEPVTEKVEAAMAAAVEDDPP